MNFRSPTGTISPKGGLGGGAPPMSTPFLPGREVSEWANHKVASNQLKIGYQVAYGYAVIATWGFRARQNSYGFRAIWSWKKILTGFSILRDLLRNWFSSQKKLCSFFPGQDVTYIKNCLSMIEGLPVGFHLHFCQFWGQNSYGYKKVLSSFSDAFFERS